MKPVVTVGHGTASRDELAALLHGAGVRRLVDVRRHPGSRAHPHVRREALAEWLPAAGIAYRPEGRLGGRRRLPAESPDGWWQVAAFRCCTWTTAAASRSIRRPRERGATDRC